MDFFALIENSFRSYRKNLSLIVPHLVEYVLDFFFSIFFGMIILLSLGISVSSFFNPANFRPKFTFSLVAVLLFCIFLMIFLFLIVNAGKRASIIYMAKETYETEKTGLSSGFKGVKSYWLQILLYLLIVGIVFFIAIALPMIFVYLKKSFLAVFSLVFLSFFSSLFYFVTLFAPQKIVVENCNAIEGIGKSFRFVRGNLSNVILYGLFVSLFYLGLAMLSIPFIRAPEYMAAFFNLIFIIFTIIAPPYFEVLKTYMVVSSVSR